MSLRNCFCCVQEQHENHVEVQMQQLGVKEVQLSELQKLEDISPSPSQMIVLSTQKSISSSQTLFRHLERFHGQYTRTPSSASFALKYAAPKQADEASDLGGSKSDKSAKAPPFAYGLMAIVRNSALRPAQFGISVGALTILNSMVYMVHNAAVNARSDDYNHSTFTEVTTTLNDLLRQVVQSVPIAKQTCSSLLILELTILASGIQAIPNPKNKADAFEGLGKLFVGAVKSVLELRLNKDLWQGLGQTLNAGLKMFQEHQRMQVYHLFAHGFLVSKPQILRLSGIPKISIETSAQSGSGKDYDIIAGAFGKACYGTLYVEVKPLFGKDADILAQPQLRWEFYANYAVVLTQVILACHHECMKLIQSYQPVLQINHLVRKLRQEDQLKIFTIKESPQVNWNNIADAAEFEHIGSDSASVRQFFLKLLPNYVSLKDVFDETVELVSKYVASWNELVLIASSIPVEIPSVPMDSIQSVLKELHQNMGITDVFQHEVDKLSQLKKISHALLYKLPPYKSATKVKEVHTYSLVDLIQFGAPTCVDEHQCDTQSSLLSEWADDFLPKVVNGAMDIGQWFQNGVKILLMNFERHVISRATQSESVERIKENLKNVLACAIRVSSFVRTIIKFLKCVLRDDCKGQLEFVSIDERSLIKSQQWTHYWNDVKQQIESNVAPLSEPNEQREKERAQKILNLISTTSSSKGVTEESNTGLPLSNANMMSEPASVGAKIEELNRDPATVVSEAISPNSAKTGQQAEPGGAVASGTNITGLLSSALPHDLKKGLQQSPNEDQANTSEDRKVLQQPSEESNLPDANASDGVQKLIEILDPILLFLVSIPSILNALNSDSTINRDQANFLGLDLLAFVKVNFGRAADLNEPFRKLKDGLFAHLSDYSKEFEAASMKIKNAALDELKVLGDRLLSDATSVIGSNVMDILKDFGIDSIFGTLASMFSDFASARKSHSQPQRVREVSVFCMQVLARATSDVNIRKELLKRRCLESSSLVITALNQTDNDVKLQEDIHSGVLSFWCSKDCPIKTPCTYCSSNRNNLDSESERSLYFSTDADIQEHLQRILKDLESERSRAEAITDPRQKQQIILKCKMQSKVMTKLAGNIVDLGTKLSVMMDFIGDIQDQLASIDSKLVNLQVSIDSIRQDMSRLAGLPVIDIIQEHSAIELQRIKSALFKQVYVPPKVAGRMLGKEDVVLQSQNFLRDQWFINSIMFSCTELKSVSDVPTSVRDVAPPNSFFAQAMITDIIDFHRFLDSLYVKPQGSSTSDIDPHIFVKVPAHVTLNFSSDAGVSRQWRLFVHGSSPNGTDDANFVEIRLINVSLFNSQNNDFFSQQNQDASSDLMLESFRQAITDGSNSQTKYGLYCEAERRFDSEKLKLWFEFGFGRDFLELRRKSCHSIANTLETSGQAVGESKVLHESFSMTDLGNGKGFMNPFENFNPHMHLIEAFTRFMTKAEDNEKQAGKKDKNVFLLSGPAGSGKSTAVEHLKLYILGEYAEARRKEGITVALMYVSLASLKDPLTSLFEEAADYSFERKLRRSHVEELREKCRSSEPELEIVFFLDGWDELKPELQKNLWQSNNLEWYRSKSYKYDSGYPKVVFTCRSETLEEKKVELSRSGVLQAQSKTVKHYVQHFLPVESNNSDKDELEEAINFFEEWRFVPFSGDRRDYQVKFVSQSLSEKFFKYMNVDRQQSLEIQGEEQQKLKLENIGIVSPCLSELVSHVSGTGTTPFKIEFVAKWILKLVGELSTGIDEYSVDSYQHIRLDEYGHKILRQKLADLPAVGSTSASPNFSLLHVDDEDLLIAMVATLAAAAFGDVKEQNIKQTKNFYLEQLAQLRSNDLWLPSRFDKEFESIPELRSLTNTPFMVNVVTEVLPLLKGKTNAMNSIKRELVSSLGENLSSFIVALIRQMEENYPHENIIESIQQGIDSANAAEPYLQKLMADLLFNVVLESSTSQIGHDKRVVATLKVAKRVSALEKSVMWQGGLEKIFADETAKINAKSLQDRIEELKKIFPRDLQVCHYLDKREEIDIWRHEIDLFRGGIISFCLSPGRALAHFSLSFNLNSEQIKTCKEFQKIADQIVNKLRPYITAALRRRPTSRGSIYDAFVSRMLHLQVSRSQLDHVQVLHESVHLARNLAYHLSLHNLSKLRQSNRSKFFSQENAADVFFKDDRLLAAAREAAPIKRGQELSFSHKTLQEYFVAERIMHSLIEAFMSEQILPENLAQKSEADLDKLYHVDFSKLSTAEPTTPYSPRKQLRAQGRDEEESLRLESLFELVGNCPLAEYELSANQEKVAVLDFIVDRLFENEGLTKYLEVLSHMCSKATPQFPQFFRIKNNLKAIVSQKMLRRGDKCLLHEAAQWGSIPLIKFSILVQQKFDDPGFTLDIQDQYGRTPLYYALVNCRNDAVDLLAPSPHVLTKKAPSPLVGHFCDINFNNPLEAIRLARAPASAKTPALAPGAKRRGSIGGAKVPLSSFTSSGGASIISLICEDPSLTWFIGDNIDTTQVTNVKSTADLMVSKGFQKRGIIFTLDKLLEEIDSTISETDKEKYKKLFRRMHEILKLLQLDKFLKGEEDQKPNQSAKDAYESVRQGLISLLRKDKVEKPFESKALKNLPANTLYANEPVEYKVEIRATASYLGGWQDGKRHHKGIYKFANGNEYDGTWDADKMQGFGTFKDVVHGDTYRGFWVNDERSGFGESMYSNGDVYRGQWSKDFRQGRGVLSGADRIYDGSWALDQSEGPLIASIDSSQSEADAKMQFMYTMKDVDVKYSIKATGLSCIGRLRAGCVFQFVKLDENGTFAKLSHVHYEHLQAPETCFPEKFLPHNAHEFGWCELQSLDGTQALSFCDITKMKIQKSTAEFLSQAMAEICKSTESQSDETKRIKIQLHRGSSGGRGAVTTENEVTLKGNTFVADVCISEAKVYFEVELSQYQEKLTKIFFCNRNFEEHPDFIDESSEDEIFYWTVFAVATQDAFRAFHKESVSAEQAPSAVTICIALDTTQFPAQVHLIVASEDGTKQQVHTLQLPNCFAPFVRPAFCGSSGLLKINFGQYAFKHKHCVPGGDEYQSIRDYRFHEKYTSPSSVALQQPAHESWCDVTLTTTHFSDFIWTNNFGSVQFPRGTSILYGNTIVGPGDSSHSEAWWSFRHRGGNPAWSCGLVPEKEKGNINALWSREGCVALCNDGSVESRECRIVEKFHMPGLVIVLVEYSTKRATFFHDGKAVACYTVPDSEFPLRLGICASGHPETTIDILPIAAAYMKSLRESVTLDPKPVPKFEASTAPKPSVVQQETFSVGCKVMLSKDYDQYSDASGGPLKPGDVGTLVEDDRSAKPFKVEFKGKAWWYDRQALLVADAANSSSSASSASGNHSGQYRDQSETRYYCATKDSERHEGGPLCRHKGIIKSSHWSCCGNVDADSNSKCSLTVSEEEPSEASWSR